jgi:hypothetical protein
VKEKKAERLYQRKRNEKGGGDKGNKFVRGINIGCVLGEK